MAITATEANSILQERVLLGSRIDDEIRKISVAAQLLTGAVRTSGALAIRERRGVKDQAMEIAPGAEYPIAVTLGDLRVQEIPKVGVESHLHDEDIAQAPEREITRAVHAVANGLSAQIDTTAMTEVLSVARQTHAVSAMTSPEAIVEGLWAARAYLSERDPLLHADTVVCGPVQYALIMARLAAARIIADDRTDPLGLRYLECSGFSGIVVADSRFLGGLATRELSSPEYVSTELGVEIMTERLPTDSWRVRGRYPGTAYVDTPEAAVSLTGHGLGS